MLCVSCRKKFTSKPILLTRHDGTFGSKSQSVSRLFWTQHEGWYNLKLSFWQKKIVCLTQRRILVFIACGTTSRCDFTDKTLRTKVKNYWSGCWFLILTFFLHFLLKHQEIDKFILWMKNHYVPVCCIFGCRVQNWDLPACLYSQFKTVNPQDGKLVNPTSLQS